MRTNRQPVQVKAYGAWHDPVPLSVAIPTSNANAIVIIRMGMTEFIRACRPLAEWGMYE